MIYFDNAATNGFKISAVTDVVNTVVKHLSANAGRSGHRLSVKGAEIIYNARKSISEVFGAPRETNVVFTPSCTHALNTAILGTAKKGGHVITTVYEHNAVLRPLYYLESKGIIELTIVEPKNDDIISPIIENIKENTYLVAVSSASNVTGEIVKWQGLTDTLTAKSILLLVDGAQGGGHIPINVARDKISLLALAGHKGLNGILGVGVLVINDGVNVNPTTFGGTGSDTFNPFMPDYLPERLECGSMNLPAIASLLEGVKYTGKNLRRVGELLHSKTAYLIEGLKKIAGISLYSKPNECGIVAFNLSGYDSEELAYILSDRFDIAVRGGFHCAPLMHKYLNTDESGVVRVSLSPQNTAREIDVLLSALTTL